MVQQQQFGSCVSLQKCDTRAQDFWKSRLHSGLELELADHVGTKTELWVSQTVFKSDAALEINFSACQRVRL